MFYRVLNQLQKFLQKLKVSYRFGLLFVFTLSIVLVGWIVMAQQPVVLTVLMPAPDVQPFEEAIVKDFEADNPGIRINIIEGPNSANLVEDLYSSAFLLGGSQYDLINLDVIWVPKFAAAGWLLDLTNRVTKEQLAEFTKPDLEGGRYNDKLYRLPIRSDVGMLYYREDLLKAAGFEPPETFQDLMKISKALQQQDKVNWGYLWQGRQYEGLVAMFVEVLEGYGGFWVNPDTLEVGLDRPETLKAIAFLKDTIQEGISPRGVVTYIEEDTRRLFQSGEAAFLRSWPYVWNLANQKIHPLQAKLPSNLWFMPPNETSGACLGGWGLGIAKSSRHPKEAWKAIQYFTSKEAQQKFILREGYVPSRRDLFTEPEIVAKYPHFPELLQVLQKAVLRPPIAQYAQASDILQRYLSATLTGRMSTQQAMNAAAAETRNLLDRSRQVQAG